MRKNQLYEGVDFVNIFKLMYKSLRKKKVDKGDEFTYAPSDVIRQIYSDAFLPPSSIYHQMKSVCFWSISMADYRQNIC
ncbi:MAG: hypothetical protein CM15mP59_3220 [Flavobacteriaceae bacterium]|nr:MAG: hypothetical protein CM15mP59_3220 [Flavobacteriaceae bacterium]